MIGSMKTGRMPAPLVARLCLVGLILLLGACEPTRPPAANPLPVPTERATPGATEVAATPTSEPVVTATDTPEAPTPEPRLNYDDLYAIVRDASEAQEEDRLSHVPTPGQRIEELQFLTDQLLGDDLLIDDHPCCDIFSRIRTTVLASPTDGVALQMVPLAEPADDYFDRLDEGGIIVGGLIIYDQTVLNTPARPDTAVVVVGREGNFNRASLYSIGTYEQGNPLLELEWRLRVLEEEVREPFTFLSPRELCFSQLRFQSCVEAGSLVSDGWVRFDVNDGFTTALVEGALLPSGVDFGNSGQVLASVEGDRRVRECAELLESEQPEACLANVVAEGSRALTEGVEEVALIDVQAVEDATLAEALIAVGFLEVLAPLEESVVAADGAVADLPLGLYRLDMIQPQRALEEERWLGRLTDVDGATYYVYVVEVQAEGLAEEQEEGTSEVLIDVILFASCHTQGQHAICNQNERKRNFCLNWHGANWCDIIEP